MRAPDLTPRTLIAVSTAEAEQDRRPLPRAAPGAFPEEADRAREEDREAGDRRDARDPGHPADLEPDEVAERRARVDVGAAGPVEEAAGLREAEDEEQHREARREDRPDARRSQQRRRGHRQDQVDAASDDVVDRERDDLPARDDARGDPAPAVEGRGQGCGILREIDRSREWTHSVRARTHQPGRKKNATAAIR